jgi:hypothetical protein
MVRWYYRINSNVSLSEVLNFASGCLAKQKKNEYKTTNEGCSTGTCDTLCSRLKKAVMQAKENLESAVSDIVLHEIFLEIHEYTFLEDDNSYVAFLLNIFRK